MGVGQGRRGIGGSVDLCLCWISSRLLLVVSQDRREGEIGVCQ